MPKIVYEPPKLILIGGPPAVGKSCLARHLMERIAGAYLLREPMIDILAPLDRDSEEYKRYADLAFTVMYGLAEENLGTGNTVVLDATFNNVRWGERDERLDGLVAKYNPDFRLFICTVPDEVIKERMATRDNGHSRPSDVVKLANWEEYTTRTHRIGDVKYPYKLIDTTKPAEENVRWMLEELSRA